MDHRRKKRALSHYRKANKKRFLLASGVTMMTFSTGMYTTQVAKADQTATTTQVQQQTAETTQVTTETKADLTLTTENGSQKGAIENEVQATTENTQLQDTAENKAPDTTQTVETKAKPTETEIKKQETEATQLIDKAQTTVQTDEQETQTTTQPTASNEVTATATPNTLAVSKAELTQNVADNMAVSFAAVPTPDHFNIGDSTYTRADAIDIASYQDWLTQADFNKLKQLGIKTAIIKVTQGTGYVNPAARQQIEYARKAGLNVMVYHYAMFDDTSAGYAEGQHAANTMQNFGLSKETLIFADMEDDSTYSVNAQANLNSFWSALSAAGFTNHAVYTGGSYLYRDAFTAMQ